jgi:hypothetical protein
MTDVQGARARQVIVTADTLNVDLTDGRTVAVPLAWYPRLVQGTPEERNHWRFIGQGEGIHWPALDEDISVENLLSGKVSGENQRSLQQRIEQRLGGMPSRRFASFSVWVFTCTTTTIALHTFMRCMQSTKLYLLLTPWKSCKGNYHVVHGPLLSSGPRSIVRNSGPIGTGQDKGCLSSPLRP